MCNVCRNHTSADDDRHQNHNNLSSEEQLRILVLVLYWCNLIILTVQRVQSRRLLFFLFKQEWIFGYIGNLAVYSGTSNYVGIILD